MGVVDRKHIECAIISCIGLHALSTNWYICQHIAVWLFVVVLVLVLTLDSDTTHNRTLCHTLHQHYRADADEGFVYALLAVPTVLAVQKQLFHTLHLNTSSLELDYIVFERYVLVLTVTTMVLVCALFALSVWSSWFNMLVAGVAVLVALSFVHEHLVWATCGYCMFIGVVTLVCCITTPLLLPGTALPVCYFYQSGLH